MIDITKIRIGDRLKVVMPDLRVDGDIGTVTAIVAEFGEYDPIGDLYSTPYVRLRLTSEQTGHHFNMEFTLDQLCLTDQTPDL